MLLSVFNDMVRSEAQKLMLGCCHSNKWAGLMVMGRPFHTLERVLREAAEYWLLMHETDYLEAFSGHARIGDMDKLRDRYSRSYAEQGQITAADESVLLELFRKNQEYETKNGFIFIVCASGKSAEEMLDILTNRMSNSRATELVNAAAEQAKITELRLRGVFSDEHGSPQGEIIA